jgi:hypothetical protein
MIKNLLIYLLTFILFGCIPSGGMSEEEINYLKKFKPYPYTEKEKDYIEAKKIEARDLRIGLIAETDFLMLPDNPKVDTAEKLEELKAYRQALRDLPKQIVGTKSEIVLPVKPSWI